MIDKAKIIAAHLMEAADSDAPCRRQVHRCRHRHRKRVREIALAAHVLHNYPHDRLEPGLEETAFYDPLNFTYPSGTHIAEVEIDPATGVVQLVDRGPDDFGNPINPMIVEARSMAASPRASGSWKTPPMTKTAADHRFLHGLPHAARGRLPDFGWITP